MQDLAYPAAPAGPLLTFYNRRSFAIKVALLAVTTIALVPILLLKDQFAAQVYLVALAVVHVAGVVVIATGAKREHIAPDTRGLVIRLIAIACLVALIWLAAQGLRTGAESVAFWGSLFAIWLLHTAGLAMLHLRGRREATVCPFV